MFVNYKAGCNIKFFWMYFAPYFLYMLFLVWLMPYSALSVMVFFIIQMIILGMDIHHRGAGVLAMSMVIVDLLRLVAMALFIG